MALTSQQLSELFATPENLWFQLVTFASGASITDGFPTQGRAVVGIIVEGTWTAANLGFEGSLDGETYYGETIDAGGNPIQCTPATGCHIAFPQGQAIFIPYLKLTSRTAGTTTPVTQGQSTPVIVVLRRFVGGS